MRKENSIVVPLLVKHTFKLNHLITLKHNTNVLVDPEGLQDSNGHHFYTLTKITKKL